MAGEDPNPDEVEQQLRRILSSPQFRNSRKQSGHLDFVVKSALSKREISEKDLLEEVYPPFDPDSNKARQGNIVVRDKLNAYYQRADENDVVVISLPPGHGYKATFSYRPHAKVLQLYDEALQYKREGFGNSLFIARRLLIRLLDAEPGFLRAYPQAAETALLMEIFSALSSPGMNFERTKDPHEFSRSVARVACEKAGSSWLSHAILGCFRLLEYNREDAAAEFESAAKCDSESLNKSLWYAAYLMTIGREAEALEITSAQFEGERGSLEAQILHAWFLYLTRQYALMGAFLSREGPIPSKYSDLYFLMAALSWIETRDYKQALWALDRVSAFDDHLWQSMRESKQYIGPKPDAFAGFKIIALVGDGDLKAAREKLADLRSCWPAGPLQLALGYLALGNHARALAALRRAQKSFYIFMPWIHLLPLFDPIRDHQQFRAIVNHVSGAQGTPRRISAKVRPIRF